jgi:hypothetical protein
MNGNFLLDTNVIVDILADKISKDQTKIDFKNDNLSTS